MKSNLKKKRDSITAIMKSVSGKISSNSARKTVSEMQKMENDEWRVIALDKVIEKAITGYLNSKGLNSEPTQTVYKNDSLTGFMATPEAVLMLKNSPQDYLPQNYFILHKRKNVKESWRMWQR